MVVGYVRVELHIHGASSLKEKRAVLRHVKDRSRSRHNVSVAEVDHQDLRQRATLGFAAVGLSEGTVGAVFRRIREDVENTIPGGILSWEEDYLS